ncbi:TPA: hypothetical protein ACNIOM_005129 [Serratia marcescens]|uniref:hypothetical protein n=1 Tax=Serratia bockelmannii TaxID=2703793 RepID=UPI003B26BAC0
MILGVKKAINKLMTFTPWASNPLKKQSEDTRVFCSEIQANEVQIDMSGRTEGSYSVVFYITFGNNKTNPTEQFYILTSETMSMFQSKVQECFLNENFIISKQPVFDNIGTHQDPSTGICTGTFQLNISVIQRKER